MATKLRSIALTPTTDLDPRREEITRSYSTSGRVPSLVRVSLYAAGLDFDLHRSVADQHLSGIIFWLGLPSWALGSRPHEPAGKLAVCPSCGGLGDSSFLSEPRLREIPDDPPLRLPVAVGLEAAVSRRGVAHPLRFS